MKKTFFFLTMLISVATSATVTVTPLNTDYAAQKVTFKVAWTNSPSAPRNNRVWIWIDFCPVTGTQSAATFSPATITNPAKTGGNGTISGLNGRGFFIEHAATNAGTTVTATLSNAVGKFNWCAYGSDVPPTAVINAAGGYTLKGTPPFTVNGTTLGDGVKTFGAGTCITSITDLTGNPDAIVPALPSLSSPNSPSRCSAGTVTLSATVGGSTTTAVTYTWNIGGTQYTNQTNSYTTGTLSTSTTYSVKVKNANNCESNTVNGTISVNYPGTDGNTYNAACGCIAGTTNCNGTCKTTGTYTTEDGACTGVCRKAWVQLRDQCGFVMNEQFDTFDSNSCITGCTTTHDSTCRENQTSFHDSNVGSCRANKCQPWAIANGYAKFHYTVQSTTQCICYGCN
jgi:hypothetical protein